MASIKDIITDANVHSLHAVVDMNGQKYICFTRLSADTWIICVSDGYELWRKEMDMEEIDTHRDLAEVTSIDAFLSRFRSSFTPAEIQISQVGLKISLNVGVGSKALRFELYEPKAVDKRTELHDILFRFAESLTDMKDKLDRVTLEVESLKQQRVASAATSGLGSGLFDMDSNKKKTQPKVQPKTVGMSILNPGSKKRKTAGGVVFD